MIILLLLTTSAHHSGSNCLQDSHNHVRNMGNDGAGPNEGAGTRDGAGTSETNGNVPGSASGSEEGPKAGTDAETSVGITAPLVCSGGAKKGNLLPAHTRPSVLHLPFGTSFPAFSGFYRSFQNSSNPKRFFSYSSFPQKVGFPANRN